jgi:hypothetical protein
MWVEIYGIGRGGTRRMRSVAPVVLETKRGSAVEQGVSYLLPFAPRAAVSSNFATHDNSRCTVWVAARAVGVCRSKQERCRRAGHTCRPAWAAAAGPDGGAGPGPHGRWAPTVRAAACLNNSYCRLLVTQASPAAASVLQHRELQLLHPLQCHQRRIHLLNQSNLSGTRVQSCLLDQYKINYVHKFGTG